MSNSVIPTAPMYGAIVDNSSEVISFPQTTIPAAGGIVSGALVCPGVPYTASLDATSAKYATVSASEKYVTVVVPANATGATRTLKLTITQHGESKEVTFTQINSASSGFLAMPSVLPLGATVGATAEIALNAAPTHHFEIVCGATWMTASAPAADAGIVDSGLTPAINVVPAIGGTTITVKATAANTPADKKDKTTTAPDRQSTIVIRNLTTGEEISVLVVQAGGKNA